MVNHNFKVSLSDILNAMSVFTKYCLQVKSRNINIPGIEPCTTDTIYYLFLVKMTYRRAYLGAVVIRIQETFKLHATYRGSLCYEYINLFPLSYVLLPPGRRSDRFMN
jgi:hypothetical protein